jgi:putative transcriptional regulator
MPQLADPNFSRTVVLLCRHNEEGAFGLVLNRPAVTTGRVMIGGEHPLSFEGEVRVWIGGPVEPARSWVLVGDAADSSSPTDSTGAPTPERNDGLQIAEGIRLSASPDLLRRLFEPNPPPRARLVVGYSGWSAGQLEAELEESSWLLSDVDATLIFDTAPEEMWAAAIRRLGADPNALHMSRGVH